MDLQTKIYKITWCLIIYKMFSFILENTSSVTVLLKYFAIVFIKFEYSNIIDLLSNYYYVQCLRNIVIFVRKVNSLL